MKKLMTIFGAILFATIILTSCGGSDKKTSEDVKEVIKNTSDDVSNETENYDQSSESGDNSDENVESSSSNDCDQFIKDYEEFISSYIAILKKMKANPSDVTVMTECSEMASKVATMQSDAPDCTDAKYITKLS